MFPLHPEGVVTVRFKQAEPAEACVSVMNGRFFGGNKLVAHMWDGFTQYHGVRLRAETVLVSVSCCIARVIGSSVAKLHIEF